MIRAMKQAVLAFALLGCGKTTGEPPRAPATARPDFNPKIREAAAASAQWGMVDDLPRRAPALCAAPAMPVPPRMSQAKDAPHGEKLYFLWSNDRAAYLANRPGKGFTIVKESFAVVDGKPGDPTGLFVMTKVGGEGTDAGWIYGTIGPEGTVTSAGLVATCMGCHVDAPHDRLFGLK